MPEKVEVEIQANFPQTDEEMEYVLSRLNPEWLPLFEATIANEETRQRAERAKAKLGIPTLPKGSRYRIREVEIEVME